MLTWKLWQALHSPPLKHPIFSHVIREHAFPMTRLISMMWPVGMTLLLILLALGIWGDPKAIMPALFNPNFALIVGLILFTGTVYGLVWSTSISIAINRLRGQGKYDLLRLSPLTPFGINWAICTGYLYRNQAFPRVNMQRTRATQIAMSLPGALIMPMLIGVASANSEFVSTMLITIIHILTIAGAFYIDFVQSIVTGTLIGIHIPIYTRTSLDSRLFSGATFLISQILTYLLAWIIGFNLLPQVYSDLKVAELTAEFTLPILRLLIFYLCHEVIILALWRILSQQLDISHNELDVLIA